MSQVRNKRQNNIRAGIFVSVSIILGLIVFTILTDAWSKITTKVHDYTVTFTVSEGIGTLASGSKVRLGGVLVGDVVAVTPKVSADEPTTEIDVNFQIDKQYTIYENAVISSRAGLLGSTGWLSISDVGDGVVANSDSYLHGTTETIVSQMLGSDSQINITKSLAALKEISESLSQDGGALRVLLGEQESKSLHLMIQSAETGLESFRAILESTETVWPTWEENVTTLLQDSRDLPSALKEALVSIQNAVADVRTNVLPNVEQSMQSLKNTMASLETMSAEYEKDSPNWSTKISNILSNTAQITNRAEKAIDEISASPWRLLYRPTDREIAYEQLNAASWQLLTSLSDLRESADMLVEISNSKDAPADASGIADSLLESAQEFENARQEILERMKIDFPER